MLKIENLTATVKDKQILNNLNIEVKAGEVHAIMGPNGSGKSTLANVIAGRDGYEVTSGSITYLGKDLLGLSVEDRACEGIFLAFQYPVEIPGVSNIAMLKVAVNSIRKYRGEEEIKAGEFLKLIKAKAAAVDMKQEFLQRSVNEGFSGGEKKRNEIFQMVLVSF